MKKVLSLLLLTVLLLTCLASCNEYEGKVKSDINENYAIITLDDFSGKHTFKVERTVQGEGMVYYQVSLTSGTLTASFYENSIIGNQPLFTVDAGDTVNGSTGYLEGNGEIEFTIEADSSVSGEIIVAFSEDVLKAVHGELKYHKHTFVYEKREDAHKRIYTCDCTGLEKRDFESHYDEDNNGECDECEYFVGVSHEDHNWGYDVNETSHRQIFGCGCISPESYEDHYNNDGDNLCDACGYEMT